MALHNLLVLSDIHLGSDLVHCARPEAPLRDEASERRDRQLVALLDWYRDHRRHGVPWKLVIAGDLVDFVGMSVTPPGSDLSTPPDEDDRTLGLGGAEDHTRYKLRCVARRHAGVFESLARFVAEGNTLVVIRGNHDVDFHWPSVQDEFMRQLSLHAAIERGTVEFRHWFYYEEGRVYVEHGHQYDRYCSYENVLHPVSPVDPRRSSRSLSDVLLRHIVRPTRGLLETGHERAGALDYVAFAFGLGVRGTVLLGTRFLRAVAMLFGIWRASVGASAARIRRHHEARMEDLAARFDLQLERLRALARLQSAPVAHSFLDLARTVMLDRIALGVLGVVALGVAAVVAPGVWHALAGFGAAVGTLFGVSLVLSRARPDIEPSRELRDGAARVASLFPAAFVVMGHTHVPEVTTSKGTPSASTYVNLGAWADVEGPAGEGPGGASRTHLVVSSARDGSPEGELLVWDADTGPRRFVSAAAPRA